MQIPRQRWLPRKPGPTPAGACLLTGWVLLAACASAPAEQPVEVRSSPDTVVSFDGRRQAAERVVLRVSEAVPGSGTRASLEVAYVRLPAATATPGAPVVFLMGGPGVPASAMARVPPYYTLFERLRAHGDVILLDQRGTGLSRPSLDCPRAGAPPADFLATRESLLSALRAVYAPCVAHWRAQGFPPELFTVAAVVNDVERIRRALAVPRISLLGFSYGSRIAVEYAVRHPARLERLILQGPMAFEHSARLPATLEAVVGRLARSAAADTAARALTPDLRAALTRVLDAATAAPLRVWVRDGEGDSAQVLVGRGGLQAIVGGRAADPRLPALLAAIEAGDLRVLASLVAGIRNDLAAGGGSLFGRALYCSAPSPPARLRRAAEQAAGSLLGDVFDNAPSTAEFCRAIGITPGPPPAPSVMPLGVTTLLITGTLDDRTPLENVPEVQRYFRTARSLIVENGGHELLPQPAVQDAVLEFLATGRLRAESLVVEPPRFPGVEEALRPVRR